MVKNFLAIVRENRSWVILALLFFLGGFTLSYAALKQDPALLTMLEKSTLALLEELGKKIFSGSLFQGAIILFMHNLMSTMYIMFFGFFVGLPSMVSAIANGSILGVLAFRLEQNGISPLPFLTAGILPHGIFELPAFFISVALGLKLGYHIVFPLPETSRMDSLRLIFREMGKAIPIILVLLAVAAVVEIFITPLFLTPFL